MKKINLPLNNKDLNNLNSGDAVLLSGSVYTARDQAHKRFSEAIKKNIKLPFDLKRQVIYYCGPTQAPKGRVIGSCGPTTSSRMDGYVRVLLEAGLKGMIGKGRRSDECVSAIKKHKAVYFLAYAGCGALLSGFVKKVTPVAYRELGPEQVLKLEIKNFPAIVGIDPKGRYVYGSSGLKRFR